ncbi:MAG TPA: hypothetical protein VIM11_26855 [Tepidisphaeraceae bacterium]|jgi:hypothetical protein
MRDPREQTDLAAAYVAVLVEIIAVTLFIGAGFIWLAIWSGA